MSRESDQFKSVQCMQTVPISQLKSYDSFRNVEISTDIAELKELIEDLNYFGQINITSPWNSDIFCLPRFALIKTYLQTGDLCTIDWSYDKEYMSKYKSKTFKAVATRTIWREKYLPPYWVYDQMLQSALIRVNDPSTPYFRNQTSLLIAAGKWLFKDDEADNVIFSVPLGYFVDYPDSLFMQNKTINIIYISYFKVL